MPEVPAVPGTVAPVPTAGSASSASRAPTLGDRVAEVFAHGGPLARTVPDFEPRAGQAAMADAVARTFERGGVLLAEAGTGTGKTLAYLVPAILSGERVLISTGTKNLQEQIFFKDIPALREALGITFTATCMKGRANYLCLHRLDQLVDAPPSLAGSDVFLPMIHEWSARTETGDRAELDDLPEDLAFWNDVSATADTCLGAECPRYDDCFVTRMRQRAAASDLVIVNHHLLCADAAVRQNAYGEVIPAFSRAILDEAHQLEDVATQYFGFSVSTYRVEELARDVERLAGSGSVRESGDRTDLAKGVARLREHARAFFDEIAFGHREGARDRRPAGGRGDERIRASASSLANAAESAADLTGALDFVESALALLRDVQPIAGDADRDGDSGGEGGGPRTGRRDGRAPARPAADAESAAESVAALARRAGELRTELRFLLRAGDEEYVYFVELRGRGVFLRAAPIDVSAIIRELLLDRMRTTVLTSATLTVDGTFDYIRERLGIAHAEQVRFPSEFDFGEQAIVYLPLRMPDPRSAEFGLAAGREVVAILERTRGRAFVLFTSYASLRAVQAVAEMALDYPILSQGTAPRSQLLKQFRETPHAVLFATSSFWQGVDVIGEALSCVIVDKLPFASPSDPITAARIESIRARGGEPFDEYQVPLAILALQQGLGRLIRHRHDRGVLAVLDPRLRTKGYGRRFAAALPPAPVVHDLARIAAFFSR